MIDAPITPGVASTAKMVVGRPGDLLVEECARYVDGVSDAGMSGDGVVK